MSLYPRDRITEAIQDSANRGIALVIAPAGFGKTEAVTDAFGTAAHWVAVAETGTSVESLAREIIASAAPAFSRALAPLLARAADAENRAHLLGWVSAHLRSVEQPIVLDDFQRACHDADALAFVRELITSTVPNLRWVLVSRETPELPIGTWLARDYMTLPVTNDDLAFDVEEAAGVATAMDVAIDEPSLAALVADSSGWPLAVRLSLGLWERTRALPPLRIRTRGVLFDVLETEVWSRLSETERDFFEAAAHLTELRPRILSAAGFPESRLSLERLQRRLPLLAKLGNGAYRLHDLFREFILERPTADPDARASMITRLARALERFGTFEDALAMSMRAKDWPAAIGLLGRRGVDRIESGHRAEVIATLAQFPRSYRDHPVATGLRGYALAIDGSFALARRELEVALAGDLPDGLRGALRLQCAFMLFNEREYAAASAMHRETMRDEHFDAETRLKASAALALSCALGGDVEGSRDAMGFCAPGLESGSIEVRAFVRHRLAFAHLALGEYPLAEQYATECAQLAHSVGLESLAARAYSILQNVAGMTYPDTLLIRRYAEACLQSADASGDRAFQLFALESLTMLACDEGDDELFETAGSRLRSMQGTTPTMNGLWLRCHLAMRDAAQGALTRAVAEMERIDRTKLKPTGIAFVDALLAVLLASSDPDRAEALLARPVLAAADLNVETTRFLVFAQTYHALGQWLIGRGRAARRSRLPNVNDLVPSDAVHVNVIATICSTSRQTTTSRQLDQLTEPLVALGHLGIARFLREVLKPTVVHELTRTELDVLRALRTGGTTAEVAERLGKSSHTVHSHIKSACTKIGCSGRAAAVSYAVAQGWLD